MYLYDKSNSFITLDLVLFAVRYFVAISKEEIIPIQNTLVMHYGAYYWARIAKQHISQRVNTVLFFAILLLNLQYFSYICT